MREKEYETIYILDTKSDLIYHICNL